MRYLSGLIVGLLVGVVLWVTTDQAYFVAIGAVFGLLVGALRVRGRTPR